MSRNGVSLEGKQAWMREKHAPTAVSSSPASVTLEQHHYSVAEVAAILNCSQDKARKIFENEPGVLDLGGEGSQRRRRYRTLRIPASVLERVYRRMRNP